MKAFTFRLDRVLQWRAMQVTLQQARASAAGARVAAIENVLEMTKAEIRVGAAQIAQSATGTALGSYAGFVGRGQRHIKELDIHAAEARKALGAELKALGDANRKAQLLENLREAKQNRWQRDFDRETTAIADEAFLARLKSDKLQSRKQTGA